MTIWKTIVLIECRNYKSNTDDSSKANHKFHKSQDINIEQIWPNHLRRFCSGTSLIALFVYRSWMAAIVTGATGLMRSIPLSL